MTEANDALQRPSRLVDHISYTPEESARVTGRSRTRIFKAIRQGELSARKDGRATIIEAEELRRWVRSFPAMGGVAA
jgi:excisionase family DNA binding protein